MEQITNVDKYRVTDMAVIFVALFCFYFVLRSQAVCLLFTQVTRRVLVSPTAGGWQSWILAHLSPCGIPSHLVVHCPFPDAPILGPMYCNASAKFAGLGGTLLSRFNLTHNAMLKVYPHPLSPWPFPFLGFG